MTSLPWQTGLQDRQCHALCTLGKTSKCGLLMQFHNWSISLAYCLEASFYPMGLTWCIVQCGLALSDPVWLCRESSGRPFSQLRTCQSWSMSGCALDCLSILQITHVISRIRSIFSGLCNRWAKGHSPLRMMQDTSFWLKCWKLRCHDFSALADWSPW